jgi:hypothetical protein
VAPDAFLAAAQSALLQLLKSGAGASKGAGGGGPSAGSCPQGPRDGFIGPLEAFGLLQYFAFCADPANIALLMPRPLRLGVGGGGDGGGAATEEEEEAGGGQLPSGCQMDQGLLVVSGSSGSRKASSC